MNLTLLSKAFSTPRHTIEPNVIIMKIQVILGEFWLRLRGEEEGGGGVNEGVNETVDQVLPVVNWLWNWLRLARLDGPLTNPRLVAHEADFRTEAKFKNNLNWE